MKRALSAFGLFDEETKNWLGPTGGQLLCQESYAKDPAKGYVGGWQWLIANALKPNDLLGIANARVDLFGPALRGFVERASRHLATMTFVGEDLAVSDNRVTLRAETDRFGLPLPAVTHAYGANARAVVAAGMA